MHRAYKAHIISTIVDHNGLFTIVFAYKAHIISTIVDESGFYATEPQPTRLI